MQSWRARLAALILERLPLLFARQARDCDIRAIESGLDQRHPGGIEH